jgi:hypothetical protein
MPKRSREEKLAAYSKGAKRGYRSRKAFVAHLEVAKCDIKPEMKEPSTGGLKALDCQPGEADALRALGNAGSRDAAQITRLDNRKCNLDQNAQTVNRVLHLLS